MKQFISREYELTQLNQLLRHKESDLVVLRGRRRIGKSRLAEEFAIDKFFLSLIGLAPSEKTTEQSQRDEFSGQLAVHFNLPPVSFMNWTDAFRYLSHHLKLVRLNKPIIILFDEISWMGGKDPHFLGQLKTAWDMYFSKNPQLVIALCGSISSWIEKNILSSTGFLGRITIDLLIEEEDGFTIVDWKTDRVDQPTERLRREELYAPQLAAYERGLRAVLGPAVQLKAALLVFARSA